MYICEAEPVPLLFFFIKNDDNNQQKFNCPIDKKGIISGTFQFFILLKLRHLASLLNFQ